MDRKYVVEFDKPCFDTEDGDATEVSECNNCGNNEWDDCEFGKLSKHYDSSKHKDSGKLYLQTGKERFLKVSDADSIFRNTTGELTVSKLGPHGGLVFVEPKFEKRVLKWFKDRS